MRSDGISTNNIYDPRIRLASFLLFKSSRWPMLASTMSSETYHISLNSTFVRNVRKPSPSPVSLSGIVTPMSMRNFFFSNLRRVLSSLSRYLSYPSFLSSNAAINPQTWGYAMDVPGNRGMVRLRPFEMLCYCIHRSSLTTHYLSTCGLVLEKFATGRPPSLPTATTLIASSHIAG